MKNQVPDLIEDVEDMAEVIESLAEGYALVRDDFIPKLLGFIEKQQANIADLTNVVITLQGRVADLEGVRVPPRDDPRNEDPQWVHRAQLLHSNEQRQEALDERRRNRRRPPPPELPQGDPAFWELSPEGA